MSFPVVKAPNLPMPTREYALSQQEQFANALRIYFNTLDRAFNLLTNVSGGYWLNFPHIAASDTADQYATADSTATIVLWNTLDSASGFTLNLDGSATALYDGVYKIDYSLQFANTDNVQHNAYVWLRLDTTDVPRSTTKFSVQARKSAGVFTFLCAYSSIVFSVTAGQKVWLYWATDKAYSTTGPVDGVYMEYQAAQTTPFAHPSVPSAIGSITFVSNQAT